MMAQVGCVLSLVGGSKTNCTEGTIKGPQPNTYDVAMYGVNTFIGSLYLCALRYR